MKKRLKKDALSIRKLNSEDAYLYSQIAYGERLHNYACFFEAHSIEDARRKIADFSNQYDTAYGLFTKGNRLVAVYVVCEQSDNSATVHYFVGERYWGNHYASRGIELLTNVLHEQYDFLIFEIRKSNIASLKVQKRIGSELFSSNSKYSFFKLNIA